MYPYEMCLVIVLLSSIYINFLSPLDGVEESLNVFEPAMLRPLATPRRGRNAHSVVEGYNFNYLNERVGIAGTVWPQSYYSLQQCRIGDMMFADTDTVSSREVDLLHIDVWFQTFTSTIRNHLNFLEQLGIVTVFR